MSGAPLSFDRGALESFARLLPRGGLALSAGRADPAELRSLADAGLRLEAFTDPAAAAVKPLTLRPAPPPLPPLERSWSSSFLLLSLPREHYDGIWSHHALEGLPPEGWQRTLGTYFGALKPGGILFFSFVPSDARPENEVASLLRQSGFQHLSRGESPAPDRAGPDGASPNTVAFLARRIGGHLIPSRTC